MVPVNPVSVIITLILTFLAAVIHPVENVSNVCLIQRDLTVNSVVLVSMVMLQFKIVHVSLI